MLSFQFQKFSKGNITIVMMGFDHFYGFCQRVNINACIFSFAPYETIFPGFIQLGLRQDPSAMYQMELQPQPVTLSNNG